MMALPIIILAGLIFLFGASCGRDEAIELKQIQAVKAGHAHWAVDAEGKTTFVWNKPCNQ